tara:strand:- start:2795 stop:3649 length:855 start_codon:yes stop_codon:yes gene_type:complete
MSQDQVTRIIARLDIKGNNLVKGINLEGLRVLGKPDFFAYEYYNEGIDEIFYQDVVASLYGRNSLIDVISKTAKKLFIPLTVGGGIRSIKDISKVLRAGADKVSINTAAFENKEFISNAVKVFGSSTIVVALEVIKQENGLYFAFTDNGRNPTKIKGTEWVKIVEDLGAGEIILTFVDYEGTGKGIDLTYAKKIVESINIPVIIHGGFGKKNQISEVIKKIQPSGIAIASMFHYNKIHITKNFSFTEGNTDFIKKNKNYGLVTPINVKDLKKYLIEIEHLNIRN